MKIVLLFPPNWTPSMPHLALPTLTAFLREHGVEVIQRDLNATSFDEILTRDSYCNSVARLRQDYGADASRHPKDRRGLPKRDHVLWALKEGQRLAREVEDAKRIIRSERFFDGETSLPAFETIIQCARSCVAALLSGVPDPANLHRGLSNRQQRGAAASRQGREPQHFPRTYSAAAS